MAVVSRVVPRRRVLTIWAKDAPGADFWEENNGGRRLFWAPGGVNNPYCLSKTGIFTAGNTHYGTAEAERDASSGDTTWGGPDVRPGHIFRIPVRGFDEMWVQWAGELVSWAGITSNVTGTLARTYFGTNLLAWAYGFACIDEERAYAALPPVLCWNNGVVGQAGSTLGNFTAGGASSGMADHIACGHSLWVVSQGYQHKDMSATDQNRRIGAGRIHPLWPQLVQVNTSLAKHIWCYQEYTSSDVSRFPQAGDRYGFLLKVGFAPTWNDGVRGNWATADGAASTSGGLAPSPSNHGSLLISGLDTVFFALADSAGGWPAATTYGSPGTTHAFIKGRLRVILVSHTPGIPWELVDEKPDWR